MNGNRNNKKDGSDEDKSIPVKVEFISRQRHSIQSR